MCIILLETAQRLQPFSPFFIVGACVIVNVVYAYTALALHVLVLPISLARELDTGLACNAVRPERTETRVEERIAMAFVLG